MHYYLFDVITQALMWLVVLCRGGVNNSRKWPHEMISLCSYAIRPHSIFNTVSVANAAVYPPNWVTLKSPAAGQKTVGRVA